MNKARLLKVIEAVKARPVRLFNMKYWKRANCKTVCCAIGSYIERNPDCGLALHSCLNAPGCFYPSGPVGDGIAAVAAHLEITENAVIKLFISESYKKATRAAVIARIEQFIRDHDQPAPAGKEER